MLCCVHVSACLLTIQAHLVESRVKLILMHLRPQKNASGVKTLLKHMTELPDAPLLLLPEKGTFSSCEIFLL